MDLQYIKKNHRNAKFLLKRHVFIKSIFKVKTFGFGH
jgi:hypothetical protein